MPIHRTLRTGAAAVAACTSLALGVPLGGDRLGRRAPRRTMLVLLKPASGARARATRSCRDAQRSSVAGLAGATAIVVLASTRVPDTLTVRVTGAQAAALAADPLVAERPA